LDNQAKNKAVETNVREALEELKLFVDVEVT
jgi:hypothetical protein